jgi:glycine cleavage system H protein
MSVGGNLLQKLSKSLFIKSLPVNNHIISMNLPTDLRYNSSHEWVRLEGDVATVGITDHAQAELTDVVFVELPVIGRQVDLGDPTAVVESVKAASDIYAPISGEVIEGNPAVEADPSLVNTDPYGAGWIFKMRVKDLASVEKLMDAAAYGAMIS